MRKKLKKPVSQLASNPILNENTYQGQIKGNAIMLHEIMITDNNRELLNETNFLRERVIFLSQQQPNHLHILIAADKVYCSRHEQLKNVHAGKILKELLTSVGGSGGGSAHLAQGKLNHLTAIEQIKKMANISQ